MCHVVFFFLLFMFAYLKWPAPWKNRKVKDEMMGHSDVMYYSTCQLRMFPVCKIVSHNAASAWGSKYLLHLLVLLKCLW